ncbi:hypothetical protein SK128_016425 [Halocaridina rubra]|uniref:Uncharacterized protein n=1 Tax=Halocaridina rubra TaxID=373956 RepID=A0AAN8ZZY4_HALRR
MSPKNIFSRMKIEMIRKLIIASKQDLQSLLDHQNPRGLLSRPEAIKALLR